MEPISVNLHQTYRASRWGRVAYLWSPQNPYLEGSGLRVTRGSPEPTDVVVVPVPYVPDREPWVHKDHRMYLTAAPMDRFEYRDTPLIVESCMDYAYLDDLCRAMISHPQVRAFFTGSRFREEAPQLRGSWGGDYYAAVYRRRMLHGCGPDVREFREPLSVEIQAKHQPLCRPPAEPFSDEVFEYIAKKKRPLKDRPIDVFFCGRAIYSHSRALNSVTDHRLRAVDAINRLPVKNKVCIPYSDHNGRVWHGKPVKTFQFPMEYVDALLASKLVICPHGWSPWTIRSVEALACGAVVVKPEASNLVIVPDIYDATKNLMVWTDLMFEDLEHKVMYVLSHLDDFQDRADRGSRLVFDELYPRDKIFASWTATMRRTIEKALETPSYTPAEQFLW